MSGTERGKLWIEVSAAALEHNLNALRTAAGAAATPVAAARPAALLAVIKADAYGHGAALCAPVLARAGAAWLGVTDAAEGSTVRQALTHAGIAPDLQPGILLMCGLQPADAALAVAHRLTPVVWSPEHLLWLAAAAVHLPAAESLPLHLEIDTGMARQGVRPVKGWQPHRGPAPAEDRLGQLLEHLRHYPRLRLDGVLTHFTSAEVVGAPETGRQQRLFSQALVQLAASGVRPGWVHAGNTAGFDGGELLPWLSTQAASCGARPLARAGLALFGHALPIEHGTATLAPHLRQAAAWKTRILALHELGPGDTVGYNATWTAAAPTRLALLPAGYADGLRRELSASDRRPGGWVLLRGRRAPIVGRISMNLTTVDVTAIPDAALGDEVTLLGEGVSAGEHARLAGTIPYEILCAMRGTRELAG